MKLYTVVPDSSPKPNSCAVFSTHKKAWEYVQRQDCVYQSQIFASEVKGNYKYPNEVFVVKKYPAFTFDADVEDVEIFSTPPEVAYFPDDFYISIEHHIPDAKEPIILHTNFVITRSYLNKAIKETLREIEKVNQDIDECVDRFRERKLVRMLKELQTRQLWLMESLKRL